MPNPILDDGTDAAVSEDYTNSGGYQSTLQIRGSNDSSCIIKIDFKRSDATYQEVGFLSNGDRTRVVVIDAPCTYRVRREAQEFPCGVDLDDV